MVIEPRGENTELPWDIHERLYGRGDISTMPREDEIEGGNFHSTVSVGGQSVGPI